MTKLPRTYYAPDRYDYDGDMESAYEDYRTYFDDSVNDQSKETRRFTEESQIEYIIPDACPVCRDGKYCSCRDLDDPKYDYEPEFDDRCSCCGTDESQLYYISDNHAVCACSVLYPKLRPNDYPGPNNPCSSPLCVEKYVYIGEIICICNSPDLHTLLKRQHELQLTLNLKVLLPLKNDIPF